MPHTRLVKRHYACINPRKLQKFAFYDSVNSFAINKLVITAFPLEMCFFNTYFSNNSVECPRNISARFDNTIIAFFRHQQGRVWLPWLVIVMQVFCQYFFSFLNGSFLINDASIVLIRNWCWIFEWFNLSGIYCVLDIL